MGLLEQRHSVEQAPLVHSFYTIACSRVLTRILQQCQAQELISANSIHIDANPFQANRCMDALVSRHMDAMEAAIEVRLSTIRA